MKKGLTASYKDVNGIIIVFTTALLTLVNVYSVKLAARLMTGLSSLKIIAMVVVVALGVWHFIDKGVYRSQYFTIVL